MTSRNPTGRNRFDQLVWAINELVEVDPIVDDPARSSVTRDQCAVLFGPLLALAHGVGRAAVIREQQSSKSQLMKVVKTDGQA